MTAPSVDGVLVEWGERRFYASNRIVASREARLRSGVGPRAAAIRDRIRATVVRRAPQVMVKVTGGGRGMAAIAAHFRYIAKGGRLPFEDDRGVVGEGKEALRDLVWQWQYEGSYIGETSHRREAFNIMLSMPNGVDAVTVQRAAREFASAGIATRAAVGEAFDQFRTHLPEHEMAAMTEKEFAALVQLALDSPAVVVARAVMRHWRDDGNWPDWDTSEVKSIEAISVPFGGV